MHQPQPGNRAPKGPLIIAAFLITALLVVTVVGGLTAFQLPKAITEEGHRTTNLYNVVMIIAFAIFFLVSAALIYAIFAFRKRDNELPQQVHGSSTLEFTWTIIPIIILVALFIPSFILVRDLKTPPAEADTDIVVEAIGHQWWWEFNYKGENVRVQATPPNYNDLVPPTLVLPVGETILIEVRSTDVIHSFYAPNMLYKIQAIPGNVTKIHMTLDKVGIYHGQCYQFCGLRHSDMQWTLDVRSKADYDKWLSEQKRAQTETGVPDSAAADVRKGQ